MGVFPRFVTAVQSAPAATSSATVSTRPAHAAMNSAV
jgi:hypothetical protein